MKCDNPTCGCAKLPGPPALLAYPPTPDETMTAYLDRLALLAHAGIDGAQDALVEAFGSSTYRHYTMATRSGAVAN